MVYQDPAENPKLDFVEAPFGRDPIDPHEDRPELDFGHPASLDSRQSRLQQERIAEEQRLWANRFGGFEGESSYE